MNHLVPAARRYFLRRPPTARERTLCAAQTTTGRRSVWGDTPDLNSREKAEEVLTRYAGMGLSGAKLDFFDHHPFTGNKRTQDFPDTQASLKMRDYLMEIAAKQRLVLEFHGCTLPSGERRRYPHFMTAEGVAGMEKRTPKIENELTIPYVRNLEFLMLEHGGFLGLKARPDGTLMVGPRLPKACREMAISQVQFRHARSNIRVANDEMHFELPEVPPEPIRLGFEGNWERRGVAERDSVFALREAGMYHFTRCH
jgi:hypothetical protein